MTRELNLSLTEVLGLDIVTFQRICGHLEEIDAERAIEQSSLIWVGNHASDSGLEGFHRSIRDQFREPPAVVAKTPSRPAPVNGRPAPAPPPEPRRKIEHRDGNVYVSGPDAVLLVAHLFGAPPSPQ